MKPIKAEGTNAIFGAEGYEKLPAQVYEESGLDGEKCIQTVWELDDEDIRILTENKRIYVSVVGETIQPICLDVIPFAYNNSCCND